MQAQERILHNIARPIDVAGDASGISHQRAFVAIYDRAKPVAILRGMVRHIRLRLGVGPAIIETSGSRLS
jgi:hypothetical protein